MPPDEDMYREAGAVARSVRGRPGAVTAALEKVQEKWHHLPAPALRAVAAELGLPLTRVYGVATFYAAFSLVPRGRQTVHVCLGTACYVRGGTNVAAALARHLSTSLGAPSPDFRFQLEAAHCLGCCSLAPVVRVGNRTFGRVSPRDAARLLSGSSPHDTHNGPGAGTAGDTCPGAGTAGDTCAGEGKAGDGA